MKTTLNTRQWHLYGYLKQYSDNFKNLREIINDIPQYREMFENEREKEFNNSRTRRILTEDINKLKNDKTIQVIIISTVNGIKIASSEEYEAYLDREELSCKKRLKTIALQRKKARLHNQYRLVFNKEKNIIEAFKL